MHVTHDLVIRGATVVDGTGGPSRSADVAVSDGLVAEVGRVEGRGVEEIDADGLVVTPGFVDVHTHYDGQATWDPLLTPSSWHGVTTVVLGNCGVGFAPVRPDRHEWLVQLMEGVEDIPGTALHEGIRWAWESFPEYLDALEILPRAVDVAAQVPHGALRTYVMGDRGADNQAATDDDLARMAALVGEAVRAGAQGFSTNRLPSHTARDGRPVPGTYAAEDELFAIGQAVAAAGGGVVEVVSSGAMGAVAGGYQKDVEWADRLSRQTGVAVTLCLSQVDTEPELWRDVLGLIDDARARGARLVPQVAGRPLGILLGWPTKHQFQGRPSYEEVAHLPEAQRARALADPLRRDRILAEESAAAGIGRYTTKLAHKAFPLSPVPDYEPLPDASIAALAARSGRTLDEVYYDTFCQREGSQLVLFFLGGYAKRNTDHIHEMLSHPATVLGLADGGAHVALICDASSYTSMLSYWVRDRSRGPRLPLELAVAKMTSGPAQLYGFADRGVVEPGRKADLNVIDLERLQVRLPEVVHDLPAGAPRLVQRADGYVATIVDGQVTSRDGRDTGARPGRVLRGSQPRRLTP
jgi:N-acyl-D-aspartate/D-glutamate deacylase